MKKTIIQILIFLLFFIISEILLNLIHYKGLIPLPSDITYDIIINIDYIGKETINTVYTIFEGLTPALVIGYLLAFICFHFSRLNFLLRPIIDFTQLIPKTALIPVFVAIPFLGYGQNTKILIVFLISFFPVFIEVFNGLNLVNNKYLKLFKVNLASTKVQIFRLEIPSTIPFLVNGIRVSILYSVLGAVTSEIIIGGTGLGYLIEVSASKLNFTRAFAGLAMCLIIGVFLLALFNSVSKTFFKKYTYGD